MFALLCHAVAEPDGLRVLYPNPWLLRNDGIRGGAWPKIGCPSLLLSLFQHAEALGLQQGKGELQACSWPGHLHASPR